MIFLLNYSNNYCSGFGFEPKINVSQDFVGLKPGL